MDSAQQSERLALVGMACQVPGAPDVKSFWRMLLASETAFGKVPLQRWDHAPFFDPDGKAPNTAYTDVMAALSDIERFDPLSFGISPRQAEVMDPQHRLLLTTVREALEDAGFDENSLAGRPVGVYVGVSTSDFRELITAPLRGVQLGSGAFGAKAQADLQALTSAVPPARAFTMPGFLLNMAAATISRSFNLRGPSMAVDAACASSLVALHNAVLALRAGQCEVAIVAGVHVNLLPDSLVLFSKIGAVSKSGVCAPFDENADGFVLGEGVGVIVLTRESFRPAQGEVHAWLRGVACNNDGAGAGPMEPQVAGQRAAIEFALADAGVRAEDVDYIEAHGTATSVGDAAEVESLSESLPHRGALTRFLGSAKANVGHAMSAAGVIGLIKAALVLRNGVVPPQPNIRAERSELRLGERGFTVARQSAALPEVDRPHIAGVSAFGFGGTNVHVVLEAARAEQAETACTSRVIPIRGANASEVEFRCRQLLADIDASPELDLDKVANTLLRREDRGVELAIVAASILELHERLRVALAQFELAGAAGPAATAAQIPAQISEDVWYRAAKPSAPRPRVCFLFAGQGSQAVGELATLRALEPEVDQAIRSLAAAAESPGLLDVMYPAERTPEAVAALASTDRCQPALLITQLAMAGLLADVGVVPDVVLGHSVGEFAAAVAAGVLAPAEAVAFAARRGEAIARTDIPPGGMIACRADEATVRAIVAEVPGVWVANLNAPSQTVVSGSSAGLAAASERLGEAGVATRALDVSHAFHSPLLEPANAQIAARVDALRLADPKTTFVSCIAARPYRDAADVRDVWRQHALAPVRFAEALARARDEAGAPETSASKDMVFVQIGAGRALLNLARMAGVEPDRLLATGDTGPDHGRVLNRFRAQLRSLGLPVSLASATDSAGVLLSASPVPARPLWPVKPRRAAAGGKERRSAAPPPEAQPVSPQPAPPEKEGTLVQEIVALWREQTAVLAKMLGDQAVAAQPVLAAPEPQPAKQERLAPPQPPQPAPPRPAPAAIQSAAGARALAEIARVGSYEAANLKPGQSLLGDLGFDSLMLTELFNNLKKLRPDLSLADLDVRELTVARVVGLVTGQPDAPEPAAPAPVAEPIVLVGQTMRTAPARERGLLDFPEWADLKQRYPWFTSDAVESPYFTLHERVVDDTTEMGGRVLINYSSYNYLGLSGDPRVTARAQEAIARYGTSVSASRILSGEKPLHLELDAAIARLLRVEAALTLVGGHSTNVTVIGHMIGEPDIVLHDALAHNSIMEGCHLSGAARRPFRHNDPAHLDELLTSVRGRHRRALVVIEGAYSMDGDIADLPRFIEVAKRHDAMLMVDEAHSIGVLGPRGGGVGDHFDVDRSQVDIWMGTMSKSLSSCGGYIGGSHELIEYLRYTLPGFIYSCGLPPASAAASLASVEILEAEPERIAALHANADYMRSAFAANGLSFEESKGTPIVPFVVGDSDKCLRLAARLRESGVNVDPILYPAVPNDQTRLRFFVTAKHSFEQIDQTVAILAREHQNLSNPVNV